MAKSIVRTGILPSQADISNWKQCYLTERGTPAENRPLQLGLFYLEGKRIQKPISPGRPSPWARIHAGVGEAAGGVRGPADDRRNGGRATRTSSLGIPGVGASLCSRGRQPLDAFSALYAPGGDSHPCRTGGGAERWGCTAGTRPRLAPPAQRADVGPRN